MRRTVHQLQLPSDFAQRLLDNQIQFKLSLQPSKQVISNLIQLYTYGVEYYEAIRSYKYLYFQKKMNQLFMTGSALQIMNKTETCNKKQEQQQQSPVVKKMKSQKQQQKLQAFKIKQKQQKMFNQILQKTNYSVTSNQTKHIIRDIQQKQQTVQKVINKQLESQKRTLQQKLKLRKARSIVAKSMSSIQLFETPTRDSLFDTNDKKQSLGNRATIKQPIIVNFQSFINQNQESDQQDDDDNKNKINLFHNSNRKRRNSGFSKRVMSTQNLQDLSDQI